MPEIYNIYCDESCHLEKDGNDIMVLGCISCPAQYTRKINEEIRHLKAKHGLIIDKSDKKVNIEVKWTKISNSKIDFYKQLIDLFFNTSYLNFRTIIAKNKSHLDHQAFNQNHDTWYYKMYYLLLRNIIEVGEIYRIYLDIKDSNSSEKVKLLQEVLNRSLYDFYSETVERIQTIRSEEVEILQLVDLLIGAVSYTNRNLSTSEVKLELIEYIREHSGFTLRHKTPKEYLKFNIFVWQPRGL